jgi:hypothetical protein
VKIRYGEAGREAERKILHNVKTRFIVRNAGRAAIGMVSPATKIVLPYRAEIANRKS